MFKSALCFCLALMVFAPTLLPAEKNADLKPVLVKAGKPSQSQTFDNNKLGKQWAVNKGEWQIEENVLVGKELPADKHAAVLTWKLPNRNSMLRCSFQLKDAKFFHLSLNHPRGHLFRVMIDQNGMILRTDRDKKDPQSRPITLAKAQSKLDPEKWYTLQLEMQGDKVSAQLDNGLKVTGQHPSLNSKKTGYRFVMKGTTLLLDDLSASNLDD